MKQTMNAKVNNWAVELEQFNLKMEWIMGSKNTLADSLSRLLEVCPEAAKQPEPTGQEFGCACFDELEPVKVEYIEVIKTVQITENENETTTKELTDATTTATRRLLSRNREKISIE